MSRRRFSRETYVGILLRQNFTCACGCGEAIMPGERAHFDHEIPLHLGGEDAPANLRALIPKHHLVKTVAEAKARGKVRRIKLKAGLKTSERSAKARALKRIERWREMP